MEKGSVVFAEVEKLYSSAATSMAIFDVMSMSPKRASAPGVSFSVPVPAPLRLRSETSAPGGMPSGAIFCAGPDCSIATLMVAVKAKMRAITVAELVAAINRAEQALRAEFPEVQWLFFEPDVSD